MKIITFEDIEKLHIDSNTCYNWVSDMILNKDKTILPSKISMKPKENVFCNVMPSIVNNSYGGVKIVTRYPERNPSLDSNLLLFDVNTGENLAIMDANWITAMRTGAVAVHSLVLLAKSDYEVISVMGLGNTARSTIKILLDLYPQRKFVIKLLKYKNQAELFIDRFKKYSNVEFYIVDNATDLVKDSDVIISCATALNEDVCADEYFKEGVLVIPVHTRGFSNCDLFFDKVFADDESHVCHFKYFDKFNKFAEISDIVNKRVSGRNNDYERILVYNIGVSIHDIKFASKIYNMIIERNIKVDEFDMKSPKDKFWI